MEVPLVLVPGSVAVLAVAVLAARHEFASAARASAMRIVLGALLGLAGCGLVLALNFDLLPDEYEWVVYFAAGTAITGILAVLSVARMRRRF